MGGRRAFAGEVQYHQHNDYVVKKGDWRAAASLSDGAANEERYLCYVPVVEGSATVYVNGAEWEIVDSLEGQGAANVCTLDYETGKITFGDGVNGNIPPAGQRITAHYSSDRDGFVAYYDAMNAVADRIGMDIDVYCGLFDGLQNSFIDKMHAKGYDDKYDGVIYHPYTYTSYTEATYNDALTQARAQAATIGSFKTKMDTTSGHQDKEVAVSEFGVNMTDEFTKSLGNALYTANHMIDCVNQGAAYQNRHCLVDFTQGDNLGAWTQSVIQCHGTANTAVNENRFVSTPSAQVFSIFNKMTGGTQVAYTATGNDNYHISNGQTVQKANLYTTKDAQGYVYVLMVNNQQSDAQEVQLTLADDDLTGRSVEVWSLTSESVMDQNTLAEPDKVKVQKTTVTADAEALTYSLEPHSVYSFKLPSGHVHAWADDWTTGDTHHWHECSAEGCDVTENSGKDGYAAHSGGTAGCTVKAVCAACGQSYGDLADHDFTGVYSSDASGHWHKCANCDATDAKADHVYDNNEDATCNTCGYERSLTPSGPTKPSTPSGSNRPATSTTTSTEVKEDGTKITTVTKPNGTKVETTETPDGAKEVVETKKDGTVTATTETPDGTKAVVETKPDGSKNQTVEQADGTKSEMNVTKDGDVTITVTDQDGEELIKAEIPAEIPEPETKFEDVAETAPWAEEAINKVAGLELVKGTGNNNYSPVAPMTRGSLATVLHRLSQGKTDYNNTFKDVAQGKYYTEGVAWAAKANVVKGVSEDIFAPEKIITREQLAVMLARYAKLVGLNTKADGKALEQFVDGEKTGSWAVDGMAWCVDQGILKGKSGNALDPNADVTRAEVAVMLDRFISLLK